VEVVVDELRADVAGWWEVEEDLLDELYW